MNFLHSHRWFVFVASFALVAQAALIDDFESGTRNNLLGGEWGAYTDKVEGGNSIIVNGTLEEGTFNSFIVLPTANEGHTGAGMMMKYEYGDIPPHNEDGSWGSQVGIGTSLSKEESGIRDLSSINQISFWAKSNYSSDLRVRFMIPSSDVKDFGWHRVLFTATNTWTKHTIRFDTLTQPVWADQIPFNPAHATRLQWEISADDGTNPTYATIYLDDIELVGYNAIYPIIIPNNPPSAINPRPTFSWHPLNQTTSYSLQVYYSPTPKVPVWDSSTIQTLVTDTFYTHSDDLNPGYIYWRVKSETSGWSSIGQYRILDGRIPTPIPMENPTINRHPLFRWYSPQSPVTAYILQVSGSSSFTTPLISAPVTDTFFQTESIDLPLGTIYWRVKGSEASEYSEVNSFTIIDGRIPVTEPYENPTFNRKPTLCWKKPPVAVSNYTIQISTSSTFTSGSLLVNFPTADTFYTADLPIGTIYWRVRGDDSEYSQTRSITILDSRIPRIKPYTPKLTNEQQPALQWYKVPEATSYIIEIANSLTFTLPLFTFPLSDTLYKVGVPLTSGTYYWRVKSDLVSTWSAVDNFTILPDSIPFITRYNGSTVAERRPLFIWKKVSGATNYRFMLANNRSFTDAISMPLSDTSYIPGVDLALGKWFWKVSCDRNISLFCPIDSLIIGTESSILTPEVGMFSKYRVIQTRNEVTIITKTPLKSDAIRIYDISGRAILVAPQFSRTLKSNVAVWNFTDRNGRVMPAGIYIMRIATSEGVKVHRISRQ